MTSIRSDTALKRAKRWNLNVNHALYRKTGDWYHQLKRFPGALLDSDGYVVFETEDAYRSCPELRIRQDVGVPEGISKILGYTRVTGEFDVRNTPTSYEKAVALEGARVDVIQSRLERNLAARATCLKKHGFVCAVCDLDFEKRYGSIGEGFIHVHHLTPLANGERISDPAIDMRPLCPNCHAMAHRKNPPLSIDELKKLLTQNAG
ncbi:MAG: HNH endonuclease [Sterolibacterium sp.]